MNRLITNFVPGIILATVLVYQGFQLSYARLQNERLKETIKAAQNQAASCKENIGFLKKSLESERTIAKELKHTLSEWESKPEPLHPAASPVNGECWPVGKPWCYLPKSELPNYDYATIRPDGNITDETAALFGMTPEERASVEASFAKFNQELFKLDRAFLEPQPNPTNPPKDELDLKVTNYKLAVPLEKSKAVYDRFEEAVNHILKGTRSRLFLEAEARHLDYWYHELKYPVLNLTFYEDTTTPRRWTLNSKMIVDNPTTGTGVYYYPADETSEGFARYMALIDQ